MRLVNIGRLYLGLPWWVQRPRQWGFAVEDRYGAQLHIQGKPRSKVRTGVAGVEAAVARKLLRRQGNSSLKWPNWILGASRPGWSDSTWEWWSRRAIRYEWRGSLARIFANTKLSEDIPKGGTYSDSKGSDRSLVKERVFVKISDTVESKCQKCVLYNNSSKHFSCVHHTPCTSDALHKHSWNPHYNHEIGPCRNPVSHRKKQNNLDSESLA